MLANLVPAESEGIRVSDAKLSGENLDPLSRVKPCAHGQHLGVSEGVSLFGGVPEAVLPPLRCPNVPRTDALSEDRIFCHPQSKSGISGVNACLAGTPPANEIGVFCIKWMAVDAGSSAGVHGASPLAAQGVFAGSHWFQMRWIDALPVSAEVIQLQPVRDGSDEVFVGYLVGPRRPPSQVESPVSGFIRLERPNPTYTWVKHGGHLFDAGERWNAGHWPMRERGKRGKLNDGQSVTMRRHAQDWRET